MVDFVEKATLLLVDKSSGNISKINKNLRRLRSEAEKVQAAFRKITGPRIGASSIRSIDKATRSIERLNKASREAKSINLSVNARGLKASQINAMANALNKYKASSRGIKQLPGLNIRGLNTAPVDRMINRLQALISVAGRAQRALQRVGTAAGNINVPNMNPNRNPGRMQLEYGGFRMFMNSMLISLGHTIVNSIARGFAEGAKGFDVAENKLLQQNIPPDQRTELRNNAYAAARENPSFRPDQRMDFYAEVASQFTNATDVLPLEPAIDKAVQLAIQQGETAKEAVDGIAQIIKGLGQAGKLQNVDGTLNKQAIEFIEAYTAAKRSEGAQVNWRDAFQFLKYSKTSGQSLSPEQFFMSLLAAADVGSSTAGVQTNMGIKTFAAETTKKAIALQEKMGLREQGEMVKSGTNNGRTSYTYAAGKATESELLREDPNQWLYKYISGPGGYLEKVGIDARTASAAAIIDALDPLSGNRNADDWIAKTILQAQESMIKYQKWVDNPITAPWLQNIDDQSSWVQLQDTSSRIITLLGTFADKLEGVTIPIIKFFGDQAQALTDLIVNKDPLSPADAATLGVTGAGLAGGTALGLKALFGGFGFKASVSQFSLAVNQFSAAVAGQGAGGAAGGGKKGGIMALGTRLLGLLGLLQLSGSTPRSGPTMSREDATARYQKFMEQAQYLQDLKMELQAIRSYTEKQTQLQQNEDRIAKVQQEIAASQQVNGNTPYLMAKQNELATLEQLSQTLRSELSSGAAEIQATFNEAASKMGISGHDFGANAGSGILGVAASFGATVGEQIRQAVGNLSVNVKQTVPANTGVNTNLATGG